MSIHEDIKELRKKTGLSQIEFAKRVGVGVRFIRDLEQGKPTVRLDKVNQVLAFLGHELKVTPPGPDPLYVTVDPDVNIKSFDL